MADFLKITSKDNSFVKLVKSLQSSAKARREHRKFVLEGLRICDDARNNGIVFETLVFSETACEKYSDVFKAFRNSAESTVVAADNVFEKMSDTDSPQGILAVVRMKEAKNDADRHGKYIALENLADPSNLGAVSRTAEALGVSGLIVSGGCDPYSPKALRASMGTLLRIPVLSVDNIADFAESNGMRVISCVVDSKASPITDVDFKNGDIIVIGNEANGISEALKSRSDICTTIPMCGRAESLNASVAAAIAVWEMMR